MTVFVSTKLLRVDKIIASDDDNKPQQARNKMNYMQQKKAAVAPGIKAVLKKYNVKGTISISRRSVICVTIQQSPFEVVGHRQINHYWIEQSYDGECRDFLIELREAMMVGNYDHSDRQTDYFDVGWYITIQFGTWDKPHRQFAMA